MENYDDTILNTPQNENMDSGSKTGKVLFSLFSFGLSFVFIWGLFNVIAKLVILILCLVYFVFQLINPKKDSSLFWQGSKFYKGWFILILLICLVGLINETTGRVFVTYMALATVTGAVIIHKKNNKTMNEISSVIILIIALGIVYLIDK